MNHETLETFRRKLLDRKLSLLRHRGRWRADEEELLGEREADWEDTAAVDAAVSALDSLSERERLSLVRIQAALARMEAGSYGECITCGEAIEVARLRAVPDADRCAGCAPMN
jgi:RNA polymerase-binding protein DksA